MGQHFVRFYEDEQGLVDQVGTFIADGLEIGEAGIVVATAEHRKDIEANLRARNACSEFLDSATDAYQVLDATEVLSSLMVDDWPDASRFAGFFGPIIDAASQGGKRGVRIFGEIVVVLMQAEKTDAAVRLEELWNDLGETHAFSLFCAYPMQTVSKPQNRDSLIRICAEHTGARLPEKLWASDYLAASPWLAEG